MKFIKDADLVQMGLREWGTRISVLEAIQVSIYSLLLASLIPSFANVDSDRLRVLEILSDASVVVGGARCRNEVGGGPWRW